MFGIKKKSELEKRIDIVEENMQYELRNIKSENIDLKERLKKVEKNTKTSNM